MQARPLSLSAGSAVSSFSPSRSPSFAHSARLSLSRPSRSSAASASEGEDEVERRAGLDLELLRRLVVRPVATMRRRGGRQQGQSDAELTSHHAEALAPNTEAEHDAHGLAEEDESLLCGRDALLLLKLLLDLGRLYV